MSPSQPCLNRTPPLDAVPARLPQVCVPAAAAAAQGAGGRCVQGQARRLPLLRGPAQPDRHCHRARCGGEIPSTLSVQPAVRDSAAVPGSCAAKPWVAAHASCLPRRASAGSGFGQEEGTLHLRTTILPPEEAMQVGRGFEFGNCLVGGTCLDPAAAGSNWWEACWGVHLLVLAHALSCRACCAESGGGVQQLPQGVHGQVPVKRAALLSVPPPDPLGGAVGGPGGANQNCRVK